MTQELDEILVNLANQIAANEQRLLNGNATREETIDSDSNATMRAEKAIQAHTNAEIAKVLDRLESKGLNEDGGSRYVNTPDGYMAATAWNEAQDRVERAIQAERAKLKERDDETK